MRKMSYYSIVGSVLSLLMGACGSGNNTSVKAQTQEYLMVDARVRIYHDDGSRTYNDYKPFKTRTIELLHGFNSEQDNLEVNKYGGLVSSQIDSTGFFHVKKLEDRWWGIDPNGCKYVNMAINSINQGKSENTKKKFKEKFGTTEKWMEETVDILNNHGFNCAGSWSDAKAIVEYNKTAEKPLPYTINWNFMSSYGRKRGGTFQQPGHIGYPKDAVFVFDPEFETFCDELAKKIIEFKDDPNLFGHFSDNEMPFKYKSLDNFLALPKDDYGHKAAVNWMEKQGLTKDQINRDHREAFMALVGEKYFSIVSNAIKKYDPNHMYIGARFYSSEKNHERFMKAIGKYLDVITINYYNCWTPDSTEMANWANWTGKPFIITEYYTKGEDSGMGNTSGAGWIVRTQKDRGLFYQNYNLALLESKNCVGWHYFKYQDNDPTAKGVDPSNVDANKGIVTSLYEPWMPMLIEMKELNTQVYQLIEYLDN